jgi:hypothetical protein
VRRQGPDQQSQRPDRICSHYGIQRITKHLIKLQISAPSRKNSWDCQNANDDKKKPIWTKREETGYS